MTTPTPPPNNSGQPNPSGQPNSQPWAAQQPVPQQPPQQQPAPQQPSPQAPSPQQQPVAPQQAALAGGEPGFFRALFDFRFRHFITIKFAGVIYIIAIIVAALQWILWIVCGFLMGAAGSGSSYDYGYDSLLALGGGDFNPVFGILAIVLGWIPAAIQIVVCRVVLEFLVAGVRTAQNTTTMAGQWR